jgi:hypothetical protein
MIVTRPARALRRLVCALVLAVLVSGSASAQGAQCGPTADVAARLAQGWGESPVAMGLNGELMVQLWGNAETGTWTLTATTAAGLTCVVGSGEGFALADAAPGDDA